MSQSNIAAGFRKIAAELREHPERWTQNLEARDADGRYVPYNSYRACCWCAVGLIARAGLPTTLAARILGKAVADAGLVVSAVRYNDEPQRTAGDMAVAFERAAVIAEGTA